jgi:hypothetical protein
MDIEEEECDYEGDDNDYEDEEDDDPQLYKYDHDLYEKDNAVQGRRRSNRLNPMKGWQNFGKPNLGEEMAEAQNRMNIDNNRNEQPMYNQPIGPKQLPKGMRWSNKRNQMYDPAKGLREWRDQGGKPGPRDSKIKGVRPEDTVDFGDLLNIVSQQGDMIKKMLKKGSKNQ